MRYLKIFIEQCKLSFMSMAIYRANFALLLVQSFINTFLNVLCVSFIYDSVTTIAGWPYEEMMLLIGTSLLVNQLFRAFVLPNQSKFVSDINTGNFDRKLLKPIDIVFQINTGRVDLSSLMSAVAPMIILIMYIKKIEYKISLVNLVVYVGLVICGVIILSSFMLFIHSLAFSFIKVDSLMNIYYILMSISEKPKEIIPTNFFIGVFTYILPAIPIAYIPISIILNRVEWYYILVEIFLTIVFLLMARISIYIGIKRYSSASS